MTTVPVTAIETVSGRLFDLANPNVDDVQAEDIAWALSREPRFGGHTITELIYSVGQHSIQVAKILQEIWTDGAIRDAFFEHKISEDEEVRVFLHSCKVAPKWLMLYGLLHDGSEAYMRDLPSPVKSLPGLREAYLEREAAVMEVIFEKFELKAIKDKHASWSPGSKLVHWADLYARTVEAYHFMPSRGAHWGSTQKVTLIDLQKFELPQKSTDVYKDFLAWLDELTR